MAIPGISCPTRHATSSVAGTPARSSERAATATPIAIVQTTALPSSQWAEEPAARDDQASVNDLRSRLLTLSQAAVALHRSPRTIRGWIQDGRLPVIRIAAGKFVSRHLIETMLGGNRMD